MNAYLVQTLNKLAEATGIHLQPSPLYQKNDQVRHLEDCRRIIRIVEERCGLSLSEGEAEVLWGEYSDRLCAGWIYLPKEDSVVFDCLTSLLHR